MLPEEVVINIDELDQEKINEEGLEEAIVSYLSNNFRFLVNDYGYYPINENEYYIHNIEWGNKINKPVKENYLDIPKDPDFKNAEFFPGYEGEDEALDFIDLNNIEDYNIEESEDLGGFILYWNDPDVNEDLEKKSEDGTTSADIGWKSKINNIAKLVSELTPEDIKLMRDNSNDIDMYLLELRALCDLILDKINPNIVIKKYGSYIGQDLLNTIKDIKDVDGAYNESVNEEVSEEESKETIPQELQNNGIANLINNLIKSEFDAIDDYNGAISTIIAEEADESLIAVFDDILKEENTHVGQLQKALQLVSPAADNIKAGEKEAEEQITENQ